MQRINYLYQEIANTILSMIPDEWDKIYLFAEVHEEFSQIFFYYFNSNGDLIYSLNIPEVYNLDEGSQDELEFKLGTHVNELWNVYKDSELGDWSIMTFILNKNGDFKTEFEYVDPDESDAYENAVIWKYKYLGIEASSNRGKEILNKIRDSK
ncbi:antitoxin YezG family protein [Bacillus sp. Marseille-Q3570]|uniref:antitoxin YezG family protein n=1 Tax=Bacillus sp. Marseille-Q3570 TaxID=2963522 RepID=UPI0021B83427|nr:antitoxin YezG family protein [Bacillus sp. Marseille-Q3570]